MNKIRKYLIKKGWIKPLNDQELMSSIMVKLNNMFGGIDKYYENSSD